jgi:RimJ/RimL family protein N-acetyltransferase
MTDVLLRTERLVLRRFTVDDVENLVDLDGDPEVMRFVTGGRMTTYAEIAEDVLPRFLAYYERSDGYGFWAAMHHAGGGFLGWFQLRPGPGAPPDEPELGYRLRRSAWGRGYATEGSLALIDRAFVELGAARVTASALAANHASRRVLEKSGLHLVGSSAAERRDEVGGFEHEVVQYALARVQWNPQ